MRVAKDRTAQLTGYLCLAVILLASLPALASDLKGTVSAVADGDTVTVLTNTGDRIKVRLAEIDAPERGQPYNRVSRQSLVDLCQHREATAVSQGTDRYGRTIARLFCEGTDANAHQVSSGLAWAFTQYLTDPNIATLEAQAKTAKLGLWAMPDPLAPWEYRRQKREKQVPQ